MALCRLRRYRLGRYRWFRRFKGGHWVALTTGWYLVIVLPKKEAPMELDIEEVHPVIREIENPPR